MRWVTAVWLSAALVAATAALHLTTEHDLHTVRTSPNGLDTNTKPHIVQELTIIKGEETENPSAKYFASNSNSPESSATQTKSNSDESETNSRSKTSEATEDGENGSIESSDNGSSQSIQSDSRDALSNEGDGTINGEETTPTSTTVEQPAITEEPTTESTSEDCTTEEQSATTTPEPGESSDEEEDDATVVETSTGRVRGHLWRDKTEIISYLDIKYGTFKNYFEAPVSPEADEESIHEKKDHSIRCPQLQGDKSVGVSECLTLSIFKPSKADLHGASVLVHIHEGNFINESADPAIYGPDHLVSQEIILVLPNYRLGPLGFLCLQNETARGNAALKDLALALSWVKENIRNFGGDPDNIAVSGEGTAGALAGYLALSPMSKNNVKKVITESGSVLSHWAIDRNPILTATSLVTSITGSWASWEDIDIEVLMLASRYIVWRPCLENKTENVKHFMVETPWTMLQKEGINVTFMIGSAEYAGVHESLKHTAASIALLNANHSLLLPNDLEFETTEDMARVGTRVKAQYFSEGDITLSNVKNRTLYYTDMAYLGPVLRTARSLVNAGSTVYFYEFSFVGELNRELAAVEKQADGAVRGDTIGYLFYQEGDLSDLGEKEQNMITMMIELWTSFLKTGTPKAEGIDWNKFEKGNEAQEQLLTIGTETAMSTGVHVNRLRLWTEVYNQHFVDRSLALGVSPSVYTVLFLQAVFFITFFKNAGHFF